MSLWKWDYLLASEHIIYNERDALEQLIPSLGLGEGGVDIAIFVDGIFPGYEDKSYLSYDGSREYIMKFADRGARLYDLAANEYFKREYACNMARVYGCPFLLIIDADEYIMKNRTDWKGFRTNLQTILDRGETEDHNIFGVNFNYGSWDQISEKPRLWFKPWEVGYNNGSHYRFGNIYHRKYYDYRLSSDRWFETVEGLIIRENSSIRSKEREQKITDFQVQKAIPFENSIGYLFEPR